MKYFKLIGLTFLSLIGALLIAAIFVPKTYTVQVKTQIKQPRQVVFDYVRILRNQEKYSVWVMEDSTLHPEIVGTDGELGVMQRWNSSNDNVGEGEQQIVGLSADRMEMALRFKRPFASSAKAIYSFVPVSDTLTELGATFYGESTYPMNLMSYLIGRGVILKAQTQNLQNVKKILEN